MIDSVTRKRVRQRATNRCEYCRLPEELLPVARFHIEHVIPRQHGGDDDIANLALACYHCNQHKGPNLAGIDPDTSQIVALFNPRTHTWDEHFLRSDLEITGLTPVGRATVQVLAMNSDAQRQLRVETG